MTNRLSRMQFVKRAGGIAGAASAIFASGDAAAKPPSTLQQVPWPYKPLDPEAAAERAFESYLKGHCMYGAFEAIVGARSEQLGPPYTDFPFLMFKYGAGGVNGWATLCGALNGSFAAFQLLSSKPEPLIDLLMSWYQTAALPDFYPKGAKFPEVRSVAGTPICHESIAHWTRASGKRTYSPERTERCGALTASVAREAVQLLNDQYAGKPLADFAPSPETGKCMTCHERGGALENTRGKMECGGCHAVQIKLRHGQA